MTSRARLSVPSCVACGKQGHAARIGPAPWKPYICPHAPDPCYWGKLGTRLESGRCSECGYSGFHYPGFSREGVRGYRCMNPECGAIKPEN